MPGARHHGPSGDHTASHAPDGVPLQYSHHRPEQTTLYRLVQQHAASFVVHIEASTGSRLPRFVKEEFDAFLQGGILAHGFLRLRCGECGHDRLLAFSCKRLERLCRGITRPALSDGRIQVNVAGQVELELKTPWRDGATHLAMNTLEFMQRLVALVPRSRLHLIRYHGVLSPDAKLRARVVPQEPPALGRAATEVEARAESEEVEPARPRSQRMGWARLCRRVLDIDLRRCPRCGGGQVKIILAILDRAMIGKIFTHLGLDPQPPPRSKAREAGHEFAA